MPKKSKPSSKGNAEEKSTRRSKAIDELAHLIAEGIKEKHDSKLESKESFEERVRAEVVAGMEDFQKRFANGYTAILEELGVIDESDKV